jgi:hypothetical protein
MICKGWVGPDAMVIDESWDTYTNWFPDGEKETS